MTSRLFDPVFGTDAIANMVSDEAWIATILEVEVALSTALTDCGLLDADASAAVAEIAATLDLDPVEIGSESVAGGNPVIPIVNRLRSAATDKGLSASVVHRGATSQDILDTALVLIVRRAGARIVELLARAAGAAAELAVTHRDTPMVARTLGQQALPTTFGASAAGYALDFAETATDLAATIADLPVQFGGAAGTLAALHPDGIAVSDALADRLDLPRAVVPWHTRRRPIARVATALGVACGAIAKCGTDLVTMASTEVGEVVEGRSGGSSAMPHKQNPTAAITARASALRAPGLVATQLAAMDHEFQRAAGAWHAEWPTIIELLRVSAGSSTRIGDSLTDLRVHSDAMARNLALTRGALLAERVTSALADHTESAREIVTRAALSGIPLDEATEITDHLPRDVVRDLIDPAGYLGHAGDIVDRATARTHELLLTLTPAGGTS